MLTLSNKIMFSIEAVLDIAYHSNGQPVQSRQITRRQNIPSRYLEHSLQKLVKGNILTGVRGPKGGYQLARERRRISVGEIVTIVTESEPFDKKEKTDSYSEIFEKVLDPMWKTIETSIVEQLNTITIEDLCLKAHNHGIHSEGRQKLDYSI